MTKLHAIYLAIVGVLVIGLVGAGIAYKVSSVRAEEQHVATLKELAAKDKQMADRDAANLDKFNALQQQILDLRSQKQAVVVLNPVVSPAGAIAPQQVTKADLPPDVQKQLPGAADTHYTLMTDPQMVILGQRELACQQTEGDLVTCAADKQTLKEKIGKLQQDNDRLAKTKVGPWIVGLGAAKNVDGKGYTPTMLFGRRVGNNLGIMGGVQGRGDLSLWATWNFGSK